MSPLHDVLYELIAVFCRYHDSQILGTNPKACFAKPECALDDQQAAYFYREFAESNQVAILEKLELAVKQFDNYPERKPLMSFLVWHIRNITSFLESKDFDEASSAAFCETFVKLFVDLNQLLKIHKNEKVQATQDGRDISLSGMVQPATYISREGMCRSGTYIFAAMAHHGFKCPDDSTIAERAKRIYDAYIEPIKLKAQISGLEKMLNVQIEMNKALEAQLKTKDESIQDLSDRITELTAASSRNNTNTQRSSGNNNGRTGLFGWVVRNDSDDHKDPFSTDACNYPLN